MKRPIATILLLLFLFNTVGYYGLYPLLRMHSTHALNQRIDAGAYTLDETITLRLPLNLPYLLAGQGDDHRLQGSLRYQGKLYTLVSQRIEADTLYVVCLPNREAHRVAAVLASFNNPTRTLAAPLKAPKLPSSLTDNYTQAPTLTFDATYVVQKQRYAIACTPHWHTPVHGVITPPPQQA